MRAISFYPMRKKQVPMDKPKSSGSKTGDYEMVFLKDIKKGPPFVTLFPIKPEVIASITQDMKKNGFDTSQPVIIWKEANILIDGHTRCAAAESAGLTQVAAIFKSFDEVEDALRYAYGLQFKRRNLTDADKFHFSEIYLNNVGQQAKKSGWKKKELSAILSVSVGTAQKYISVISRATEKEKDAVRSGEKSINTVYNSLLGKEKIRNRPVKKSSNKTNKKTSVKQDSEPEVLMIPAGFIKLQLSYWAENHRDFGMANSPFRERILGVVDILPDGHELVLFARELLEEESETEEEP